MAFNVDYILSGSEIRWEWVDNRESEKIWAESKLPYFSQHNPLQASLHVVASVPEFAKREQYLHQCTNLELVMKFKGATVFISKSLVN